ncbi:hypothetical protein BGX33_002585, partial [Mortierella sp. NVP41]
MAGDFTQSFRRGADGKVVKIEVYFDPESNQEVVDWSDIKLAFPNTCFVKKGDTLVTFVRNAQRQWYEPLRIKHHPGIVLEVIEDENTLPQTPPHPEAPRPVTV